MGERICVDNRCTGCNVCVSSCPVQALSLKITSEGFWYPQIDEKTCINCGRCLTVCPVYGGKNLEEFTAPVSYAGWNKDQHEHISSSSGGIFSVIARSVLSIGGVVYGAAYSDDFSVNHIRIDNEVDLPKLRGSKYVQSFISNELLNQVKADLKAGRSVLFSGTPCQIAAINKLFPNHDNLLTVDVVCHGVPSPKAWKSYLNEVTAKKGKIASVNMRKKVNGWKKFFFTTQFSDGSTEECWFNDNPWGSSFVKNLFLRESCYHCEFKECIRCSDISLGDFWEAARGCHKEFDDDDRGTSIVLVNSQKGKKAIEKVMQKEECYLKNIPYHWIPKSTYAVVKSSAENKNRSQAFEMLDKYDFSVVLDKASGMPLKQKMLLSAKKGVKKLLKKEKVTDIVISEKSTGYSDYKDGVGILNVQEVDNYGAVLLCYALQETIENLGYDAWVIDYRPAGEQKHGMVRRISNKLKSEGIRGVIDVALRKSLKDSGVNVNRSSDEKKRNFENFRKEYFNRTPVYKGMNAPDSPIFRTYVVGSDVVWKPDRVRSYESDVYFLKFTDGLECNRIAYAASIGTADEQQLSEVADKFSDCVQRFDSISLREASSVPYVQNMVDKKVVACADPTLLIDKEIYDNIANSGLVTSAQKYIYFYMFGDDPLAYEYVNRCSKTMNLPVVCQCNTPESVNNVLEYSGNDGPSEFLSRIRNAEYIITDSFHGTVFSILYHKDFATLSRGNISTRMEDLLERLNLKSRFVENPEITGVLEPISNYEKIDANIADWRDESIMFLANALDTRGGGTRFALIVVSFVVNLTDCEVTA